MRFYCRAWCQGAGLGIGGIGDWGLGVGGAVRGGQPRWRLVTSSDGAAGGFRLKPPFVDDLRNDGLEPLQGHGHNSRLPAPPKAWR